MEFFGFLDGISPWWWLALGGALAGLEMLAASFVVIWPGLAAMIMAVLLWIFPTMSGEVQVASFAALAVGLTFGGRWLVRRYGQPESEAPDLNRRARRLIGRSGKVLSVEPGGYARVEIGGVPWSARVVEGNAEIGAGVEVTGAEGMTLLVRISN